MGSDPLRILLDECVQHSVARALADDGHDVIRPPGAGDEDSLEDVPVLELAGAEGRILVTTDSDFLPIHTRWLSEGRSHSGIIVGHQDQNLKRFIRNLRHTLKQHDAEGLRNQLVWIQKAN